ARGRCSGASKRSGRASTRSTSSAPCAGWSRTRILTEAGARRVGATTTPASPVVVRRRRARPRGRCSPSLRPVVRAPRPSSVASGISSCASVRTAGGTTRSGTVPGFPASSCCNTTSTRNISPSGHSGCISAPSMGEPAVPSVVRPVEAIGRWTIYLIEVLGRFGGFFALALFSMVTPPFKTRAFIDRVHYIGYRSLLIIILTGAFTGMVLGLQVYLTLSRFGSEAFLGPAVALSLIRGPGPVLAALMVPGRAGSALTAEIGIMRITEQIDALTVMALNPFRYLVTPSILAGIVTFPMMTALFDVVGIFGGYLVGVKLLGLSEGTYFGEMRTFVDFHDVMTGFWKSLSFGAIVSWVATYKGFYVGHGAGGRAVPRPGRRPRLRGDPGRALFPGPDPPVRVAVRAAAEGEASL